MSFAGAALLGLLMGALALVGVSWAGHLGHQLLARLALQVPLPVPLLQDVVIIAVSVVIYLLALAYCALLLAADATGGGASGPDGGVAGHALAARCEGLLWRGALLLAATAAEFTALFRWAAASVPHSADARAVAAAMATSHALVNGIVFSLLLACTFCACLSGSGGLRGATPGPRPVAGATGGDEAMRARRFARRSALMLTPLAAVAVTMLVCAPLRP